MNAYTKKLAKELIDCGKMAIFEIEVVTPSLETDWITCHIFFKGNSLIAQREAVSEKERKSKFIAKTEIIVDSCFDLDEHLNALYEEVINDIISGDLYDLPNN